MALRRKCFKDYFSKITKNCTAINKNFWKTIKPFLTFLSNELVLVKLFKEHYVNIKKKLCSKWFANITHKHGDINDDEPADLICKNHQKYKKIRKNLKGWIPATITNHFVTLEHVEKLLRNTNPKERAVSTTFHQN